MRVLVCGGRDYSDVRRLYTVMDEFYEKYTITTVVTGAQRKHNANNSWVGADFLAQEWALSREIPYIGHPAEWSMRGNRAGPHRNGEILIMWLPERVIAFPGGRGTADMVVKARAAGLPVDEVS